MSEVKILFGLLNRFSVARYRPPVLHDLIGYGAVTYTQGANVGRTVSLPRPLLHHY